MLRFCVHICVGVSAGQTLKGSLRCNSTIRNIRSVMPTQENNTFLKSSWGTERKTGESSREKPQDERSAEEHSGGCFLSKAAPLDTQPQNIRKSASCFERLGKTPLAENIMQLTPYSSKDPLVTSQIPRKRIAHGSPFS